jgi:hypothetical protein
MCIYTLYNALNNVTGHHGKHFLVSRQTLWLMANDPFAILLTMPGYNFLACGGIVLLPSTPAARERGMLRNTNRLIIYIYNVMFSFILVF